MATEYKLSYTAIEIDRKISEIDNLGKVKTVNGVAPDANGNVKINIPDSGQNGDDSVTLPDYVIAEANAVIDRVITAQGNRTLTLAAITDMHYGSWGYYEGVTDYRAGVNHACQALKYIDERVKLDAVAVLGDYTDGMALTQQGTAVADFKGVNSVLDKLRFAPNLRLQGNHDYVAEKSPLVYRYIGAYSDGAVEWGSPLGGYFYKDFAAQKVRVIGLNTSETGNGGVDCSVAQYEWFIDTLNMSAKPDANEWGILILSHIPLDMWPGNGAYRFAYILDAYEKGTSWMDNTVSCDFSDGKNAATIVGNIHGHVHNFKVDKLYLGNIEGNPPQIDVWRMATPNACFGLENKDYTGFKQDTSYIKTADSAKDTAFCIYCVDLDSHTITSICYGAGYDRTLNYQDGSLVVGKTYSITNKLTNVTTSNNASSVAEGDAYSATLTPSGKLSSVAVTMGGNDITSSVYVNGVINISSVTGDVVITAVAIVVEIKNALTASVNADGTAYNDGQGWKADTRWSGSNKAEQTPYAGVYLSGYIPYDGKTGTVYMKNVSTTSRLKIWYFNADDMTTFVLQRELLQGAIPDITYGDDGNVASFKLEADCDYIRIECGGFSADSIVTINQPIDGQTVIEPEVSYTNVLDTVGYTADKRFSTSSGDLKDNSGTYATGKFSVSAGDTIYVKNVDFPDDCTDATESKAFYWKADGTYNTYLQINKFMSSDYGVVSVNGQITQFKVLESELGGATGEMALCLRNISADSVITIDEPIE